MGWIARDAVLIMPEHKALDAIGCAGASLTMAVPITPAAQCAQVARLQCEVRCILHAVYMVNARLLRGQRHVAYNASVPIPRQYLPA